MTTIASYTNAGRPTRGHRLAAAALFAAAVGLGAAPLYPAMAGAEPPVTPVTPAPGPGAPEITLAPDLPPGPGPGGPGVEGGFDAGWYAACVKSGNYTKEWCCTTFGGVWNGSGCTAPPAPHA